MKTNTDGTRACTIATVTNLVSLMSIPQLGPSSPPTRRRDALHIGVSCLRAGAFCLLL